MAYNRCTGPEEGAALVFANTVQEARKLVYSSKGNGYCPDFENFLDVAAKLIKGEEYLDKLREKDVPHIVRPPVCDGCGFWGTGELANGLCPNCGEGGEEK
jgi:rubrerythrin